MWWLALIIGAISGSLITLGFFHIFSAHGTFRIDHSNPEKDVYRLDIPDLDKLSSKKTIILTVDNNADLSQK